MIEFTQGTVVYGARCKRYPNQPCYAIVITARCDIANSKTNKIFYLVGVPVNQWIVSNNGYYEIVKGKTNNTKKEIEKSLLKYGLDLDSIITFSDSETQTVFHDANVDEKDGFKIKEMLSKYRNFTSGELTTEQKRIILQEIKPDVQNTVQNINSGKNSHYIVVPSNVIESINGEDVENLVVDLQEIDYWTLDTVEKLKKREIDVRNTRLTKCDKSDLDTCFFVKESPGYAEIIGKVTSPWIEFVMQRFTNLFSRIGVDSLSETEVKELVKMSLEENGG